MNEETIEVFCAKCGEKKYFKIFKVDKFIYVRICNVWVKLNRSPYILCDNCIGEK